MVCIQVPKPMLKLCPKLSEWKNIVSTWRCQKSFMMSEDQRFPCEQHRDGVSRSYCFAPRKSQWRCLCVGPPTDLIMFGLFSGQSTNSDRPIRISNSRVPILNGSSPVTRSNSSHPATAVTNLLTMEMLICLIILNLNSSHMTWAINTTMVSLYMVGIPRQEAPLRPLLLPQSLRRYLNKISPVVPFNCSGHLHLDKQLHM